mmetsp:Transcript_48989/g.109853  ORF Transcript_48989/g.109853 Transcript_48989/m.109853 type:complete len:83 (+) Transcript_48989:265-513(+)
MSHLLDRNLGTNRLGMRCGIATERTLLELAAGRLQCLRGQADMGETPFEQPTVACTRRGRSQDVFESTSADGDEADSAVQMW